VFDVGIPNPDAVVIDSAMMLLEFAMVPALGFLFWIVTRLKPQHRFTPFEVYTSVLSLDFLFLNMIMWVFFPEYILNILLEYSPLWLLFFLGVPVVYFKTRNANDSNRNPKAVTPNETKLENDRKKSAQPD